MTRACVERVRLLSALGWVAILFAVMYTFGLSSTFQMYMPGVGQRQGQKPTWDKMRSAIQRGMLDTINHGVKPSPNQKGTTWSMVIGKSQRASAQSRRDPEEGDLGHLVEMHESVSDGAAEIASRQPKSVRVSQATSLKTTSPREDHEPKRATHASQLLSMSYESPADLIDEANEDAFLQMEADAVTGASRLKKMNSTKLAVPGTNGQSTVSFSISASEGRNIILRNLIGKVAANLSLHMQTWQEGEKEPLTMMQIIDGFADEGHRVGAYYLMRAVSTAFYLALPPPVALKIANGWIKAMNACEAAKNVDIFDEGKRSHAPNTRPP